MNVVITGVSSGLGKALSKRLLNTGNAVWGISRKEPDSPSLKELNQYKDFFYTRCDVSKEADILKFFEKMKEKNFSMDIVILNAGLMENDIHERTFSYDDFKRIFRVNFFGALSLIDRALPLFQKKGKGIFIGISSLASLRAVVRNKIAYPTSKAALNMLFEAFRLHLANPKIRFITVNLGPLAETKASILQASYKQAAEKILSLMHKKRNVMNYPFLPSFLFAKVFRFIPDSFLSKYVIRLGIL